MKVVSPPVVMTQKWEGIMCIMSYSYICWINHGKTPSSYPRYGIHVLYTSSPVLLQVPWAPGLPGYPENQLVNRCTVSLWDEISTQEWRRVKLDSKSGAPKSQQLWNLCFQPFPAWDVSSFGSREIITTLYPSSHKYGSGTWRYMVKETRLGRTLVHPFSTCKNYGRKSISEWYRRTWSVLLKSC